MIQNCIHQRIDHHYVRRIRPESNQVSVQLAVSGIPEMDWAMRSSPSPIRKQVGSRHPPIVPSSNKVCWFSTMQRYPQNSHRFDFSTLQRYPSIGRFRIPETGLGNAILTQPYSKPGILRTPQRFDFSTLQRYPFNWPFPDSGNGLDNGSAPNPIRKQVGSRHFTK